MSQTATIKVWDPLVRIFHWTLVGSFTLAYLTEDDLMTVHAYAGYTVIGLLVFRLLWGFVGSEHARFSDFVRSPREVWAYVKDELSLRARRYIGHNPAGGAMILALLVSLVLTSVTGLAIYGADGSGPLAGWLFGVGEFGRDALEETHEFFANFTLVLVVLHVAGVVWSSVLHGENLVRSMFTGGKRA